MDGLISENLSQLNGLVLQYVVPYTTNLILKHSTKILSKPQLSPAFLLSFGIGPIKDAIVRKMGITCLCSTIINGVMALIIGWLMASACL